MWFWWRGDVQQTHTLAEGGCESRGADVSMKDFSAFLDTGRCRNCAHKILSWKYPTIWRPVLPVFPRAQRASFLLSTLSSFQGVLTVSGCNSSWFNPCRGRWQVPVFSWYGTSSLKLWGINFCCLSCPICAFLLQWPKLTEDSHLASKGGGKSSCVWISKAQGHLNASFPKWS